MQVLLVFVAVVIAEVYVALQVAHHVGALATIGLLLLVSASGPWLVRRTGVGVWRRARARMDDGEMPGRELVDGVLLLAAGVLLCLPGFLTGAAGLLLLLPPVRVLVRWLGTRWLAHRVIVSRVGPAGGVITTTSRPVDHQPARDPRALGPPPANP